MPFYFPNNMLGKKNRASVLQETLLGKDSSNEKSQFVGSIVISLSHHMRYLLQGKTS